MALALFIMRKLIRLKRVFMIILFNCTFLHETNIYPPNKVDVTIFHLYCIKFRTGFLLYRTTIPVNCGYYLYEL